MNTCLYRMRAADPRYQSVVDGITSLTSMRRIPVVASDTSNACATIYAQGHEVIAYNPDFLWAIESRNHWAMVAVLAHEVGHHHYKHTQVPSRTKRDSHEKELHADWFSGYILRYMEAPLSDALTLYDHVLFRETDTHPSKTKRKESMRNGWIAADRKINPQYYQYQESPIESFFKGVAVAASIALVVSAGASLLGRR